ncbi:MAG TPA: crossover junction endodeoxyribonuclease RuvC [Rhodothermales bacterium]|nr:crossover junction endodeoxyribonuclease RuvC [Rhodothermales bacterium]HRR09380.1 crossover junction endodeoxyribonuclease RuvC [Rhodothermales bacterium]
MIILGIDPGSNFTGYGVIRMEGRTETVLEYGFLQLEKQEEHFDRLKTIYDRIEAVIRRTEPTVCAIEMPVYGRNAQSMLKLGRAQAAAVLAALNAGLPVVQYTPKEVKKSVTGNGNAAKEQVWFMIKSLLKVEDNKGFDASDALGVAVCHAGRTRSGAGGQIKSWERFVAANPNRVKP